MTANCPKCKKKLKRIKGPIKIFTVLKPGLLDKIINKLAKTKKERDLLIYGVSYSYVLFGRFQIRLNPKNIIEVRKCQ